jgi:hypothetical protein
VVDRGQKEHFRVPPSTPKVGQHIFHNTMDGWYGGEIPKDFALWPEGLSLFWHQPFLSGISQAKPCKTLVSCTLALAMSAGLEEMDGPSYSVVELPVLLYS